MFSLTKNMSRLKKKLMLYFLLISIVSLSITAEIILELGSPYFQGPIKIELEAQLIKELPKEKAVMIVKEKLDFDKIFKPIGTLQVRSILLLIVVSLSIGASFGQYTKDIVVPMEGMVSATKKIADGDLSVSIDVKSNDEIGQVGNLINDMSINLQDMILQIKQEVMRLKEKIAMAQEKISVISKEDDMHGILLNKRMRVKDFKNMLSKSQEVDKIMDDMGFDLSALQAFVNMYKVFQLSSNLTEFEGEVPTSD
jgi:methyl-accepting chemotaxis protein